MSKHVLSIAAVLFVCSGFLWTGLLLSLVVSFRYNTYVLPCIVLTIGMWLFGNFTALLIGYAILTCISLSIAKARIYFRFAV